MQIQKEADKTVFVANLGSSANEEIIFELFLQVGSYFPQAQKLDEINGNGCVGEIKPLAFTPAELSACLGVIISPSSCN